MSHTTGAILTKKDPAFVKWGLPKVAPWQVCGIYTQGWKREPTSVWSCRDPEEKLQNEGSRRPLSFSTYLDKTAESGAETFPERPRPAPGAFWGTSPTSAHATVSEASLQLQYSRQKRRFSNFKENFFHIQTQSEHTHFNCIRFTCASIKLTQKQ